jgi:phospho-N-acetylmuramoyl-pentapeptide-transferase
VALATLLFADLRERVIWVALLWTLGFGFIGFLDDWLKLSKRNSKGLAPRRKLLLQTLFFGVGIFGILCTWQGGTPHLLVDTRLTLPFVPTRHFNPNLGWGYLAFAWLVVVGASNAVNLTDGLDGLAIVPTIVAALTFAVLCYVAGSGLYLADLVSAVGGGQKLVSVPLWRYLGVPQVVGGAELAVFCASIVGAGIAFLWFNTYPATVFMGDVGSLALGGALGTIAVLIRQEILLGVVGGIFVIETLSVMIQVTSFRLTGKRVFLMAPIHHHFEKMGWHEQTIVIRFWIISAILGLIALSSLKLR